MPKLTARERPVLAFISLIALALLLASSLVPAVGGAPVHAEGESASELPFSVEPSSEEPPPPVQCSDGDSAGELPQGTQAISGIVTDQASDPVPLGGIQVRFTVSASGAAAATVFTDAEGEYALGDLGDGTYLVSFFDSSGAYQSGFHGPSGLVLTPGEAEVVELSGTGAVVDAALPDEALRTVEGTVTNIADQPVGGILLTARSPYFPMSACQTSLSNGGYAITNVRTMAFRLEVTDFTGAYPNGFYAATAPGHFTTSFAEATILRADSDPTVDVQFPALYTLSGIVQDDVPDPIDGITVSACDAAGEGCRSATSEGGGRFTIAGLVAGDYIIGMDGSQAGYLNGWYDGQGAFTRIRADADPVTVSDDVIGLDLLAVLAPLVYGTVSDEHGSPLGEIAVSFNDDLSGLGGSAAADGGAYAIRLQPGTYTLRVDDQRYPAVYPSGYLGEADPFVLDPAQAMQIIVGEDDVLVQEVTIPDGGTIDLSVLMGGTPAAYASIEVCQAENFCPNSGQAENGEGSISAIVPGPYFVKATPDGEHFYWYVSDDEVADEFAAATAVTVVGLNTTDITVNLPSPGTPTDPGTEVEVPLDDGTGETPVVLTFENVEVGGTTSLTIPPEEPTTPAGFKFGEPPTYYEITTTAILVEGSSFIICVTFDPADFDDPEGVELFHFDSDPSPGGWEPITLPDYPVDGLICGSADSLSPFALVEREYSFAGFFGVKAPPRVNVGRAGDLIGIQFSLGSDIGLDVFEGGSPTVQRVDCVSGELIGSPATAATGSPPLKFNARTERYTFQWKTEKSWKNSCQLLVLTFRDGSSAEVLFSFKK